MSSRDDINRLTTAFKTKIKIQHATSKGSLLDIHFFHLIFISLFHLGLEESMDGRVWLTAGFWESVFEFVYFAHG